MPEPKSESLSHAPPGEAPPARPSIYQNGRLRYEARGLSVTPFTDLYHFLMRSSWWKLLLSFFAIYCSVNGLFAALYWWGGDGTILNARAGSFADAFWFSVQTFATIGYGVMSPASSYAHALVTLESFSGMLSTALATGILFAKFAKPVARVGFSQHAVINSRNGEPCLMWRLVNRRQSALLDAQLKAHVLIDEVSSEGQRMRRAVPLKLERHEMPMFLLAWTAIHRIDSDSPLFGLDAAGLEERMIGLIVSFGGVDDTMVQNVHTRHTYTPADVRFGFRFADMIDNSTPGRLIIDHTQLNELLPEGQGQSQR